MMKAKKNVKHRKANGTIVAMRKRHPRAQPMRHRTDRRSGDTKNHWSNDWR